MTLRSILFATVLSSSLLAGCLVSGTVRTRAYVAEPELVYVAPGVEVVADYDQSVFYSDGYYWRYDGGAWYRSGYYNSGWVQWNTVPVAIGRIDRPQGYVRYHGDGQRRRVERQEVRDHRRDVRQERREDRRERKEDRRERKEDRRERKEDRKDDRVKVRDHRH